MIHKHHSPPQLTVLGSFDKDITPREEGKLGICREMVLTPADGFVHEGECDKARFGTSPRRGEDRVSIRIQLNIIQNFMMLWYGCMMR